MSRKIKGITVTLYSVTETDTDPFGDPVYEKIPIEVDNVLVSPSTTQETLDAVNLYGKKAVYTLAIPKGDTHEWENRKVKFFGQSWRAFSIVTEGIDANIPLSWNKKVMVERDE